MKLLFINPPRSPHNAILQYAPEKARRFIHKKLIGPPLGLLTISSACRDHDVRILDMKGEYDLDPAAPAPEALTAAWMNEFRPDVVGVTFIASEFDAGMAILRAAKRVDPAVLTVAGGLHATVCPGDFAGGAADAVIPGQCADIFNDVLQARERLRPLEGVPGIFLNTGEDLVFTGRADRVWEPAGRDFVYPDRSLLKKWISTYRAGGSPDPSTYVFTSLGCPYRCTFCSIWSQFDGRYLQREVESVIRELSMIPEYPVVRFADANTIVSEPFMSRLFDRIREEGIRKTFIMDVRFDTAVRYPALIEKLAQGGLKVVICGFESFREEELRKYRKEAQAGLIEKAISIFHANDIMVRGNYVIPADYGEDDFRAMAEYAGSHRVVYAGYTILTPMPGTVLHEEMKDRIVDRDLSKYNFFNSVMKTTLPYERFHENVGRLWLIKEGTDVI
jgi:hopanoid C-3 methylase